MNYYDHLIVDYEVEFVRCTFMGSVKRHDGRGFGAAYKVANSFEGGIRVKIPKKKRLSVCVNYAVSISDGGSAGPAVSLSLTQ